MQGSVVATPPGLTEASSFRGLDLQTFQTRGFDPKGNFFRLQTSLAVFGGPPPLVADAF
jgi:hypothetical protein